MSYMTQRAFMREEFRCTDKLKHTHFLIFKDIDGGQ